MHFFLLIIKSALRPSRYVIWARGILCVICTVTVVYTSLAKHCWKAFSEIISSSGRPHFCLLHRIFSQSNQNKTLQSLCKGSACFKLMNQDTCEFHDISFIKFFIFHDGKRVILFSDLEQK